MAKQITDPEAKRAMLEIAKNYEQIAKRAEGRVSTRTEDRR
jgi:hypothetical protein